MVENKNLIGYCGLYCGACGIYQGKIKQAVENLRKIINFYGFDKISADLAAWEPAFQHYKEFENVMDGLVKIFGECPACNAGGGDPACVIRMCIKQKGYTICAECADLETCEKVQRFERAKEGSRKIKAMGVDKWAEAMKKKVDAGYCYDENIK